MTHTGLFLGEAQTPLCRDAADADDSGFLDSSDAARILGCLFLGQDAPPEPGPHVCRTDPTPDAIGCAASSRDC